MESASIRASQQDQAGKGGMRGWKQGQGHGTVPDGDIIVSAQERSLAAGPKHKQAGHLDDARAA